MKLELKKSRKSLNNYQYDIDNLFVKEAYVGKSLVMKRFRPRAKGRASPIKKPFSRITIVLEEKIEKKESNFIIVRLILLKNYNTFRYINCVYNGCCNIYAF